LTSLFRDLSQIVALFEGEFPGNLFAVVRHQLSGGRRHVTPPRTEAEVERQSTIYDYTASLLLTADQKNRVHELCSSLPEFASLQQPAWQLLEQPLGASSRSIADTVFDSGIVDFSVPGEREDPYWTRDYPPQQGGRDRDDGLRRRIEDVIYRAVRTGAGAYEIFYIPVCVGQAPWIALYTFSKGVSILDDDAWRRNYYLYRDVRPSVLAKLRELGQQAYAECLATILRAALQARRPIDRVNEEWRNAVRFYPFPVARLTPGGKPGEQGVIELPDGTACRLGFDSPSPWIEPQVPIGELLPDMISAVLEENLRVARNVFVQTQIHVLDGVAHSAFNALAALNSAGLGRLLGGSIPPTKLSYALVSTSTGERDSVREALVLRAIRNAFFAEEVTRGSLALGRILASDGRLVERFCGSSGYPLKEVLEETRAMVEAYHESDRRRVGNIILVVPEVMPAIASGYLEKRILGAILFEILFNHAKHGGGIMRSFGGKESREVEVTVRVSADSEQKELALRFLSIAPQGVGNWWVHPQGITIPSSRRDRVILTDSFLFRFAEISRLLQGAIRIETLVGPMSLATERFTPGRLVHEVNVEVPDHSNPEVLVYVSQLFLGPLLVRSDRTEQEAPRAPIS
jgi:hypothetical protein